MAERKIVPSVADINASACKNGFKVISTFAGCGGSSMGYKMAGFAVPLAVEFVPEAAACYRKNAPTTKVLELDLRTTDGAVLLKEAGIELGDLDVLDGSPPCQGFATGGLRHKGWGKELEYSEGTFQRVDDLFFEYARLVKQTQPKVFIAENVKGLVSGKAQGYYMEIHKALEEAGYVVENKVINASRLGVPQKRNRLIVQGIRRDLYDLGVRHAWPQAQPASETVSIAEALVGLPECKQTDTGDLEAWWLKPGSKTRVAWEHTDILYDSGCLRWTYIKLWHHNARYHWFRLDPTKPSVTVTAKIPCLLRWDVPRTFNILEIKRLQSFPDDFDLEGYKFDQRWERIGRAVPPLLMKAVAERIRDDILIPLRDGKFS
jgi:DNA (cytosine-5)-methyltransferase 1